MLLWFGIGTPGNRASFRALRWRQRERRVSDETITRMKMYGWVVLPCFRREHAKRRPAPVKPGPQALKRAASYIHIFLWARHRCPIVGYFGRPIEETRKHINVAPPAYLHLQIQHSTACTYWYSISSTTQRSSTHTPFQNKALTRRTRPD